ncbi:MAG: caspase family protein [Bacteroidota bacterium]
MVSINILLIIFSALLPIPLSDSEEANDYAEVYIYRPKQFQGGAIVFKVLANDNVVTKLTNGSRSIYRIYHEGALDLKLKASVFTSKTVSFGVVKGQKYYLKAGYGDGFGSKLSFTQLGVQDGEREFSNIRLFHGKKIKVEDEDPDRSVVTNEDVYSKGFESFEQKSGKRPNLGWISPAKANFKTEVSIFSLQLCLKSDAEKVGIRVGFNDEVFEELKDVPISDKKCGYTYITNLYLEPGENKIAITLFDEFGESNFSRTIKYDESKQLEFRGLALVIGNSDYEHAHDLKNPKNDASDMYSALNKLGFEVLKFDNLSDVEMRKVIGNYLLKLEEYKVGVIFYAGHGIQHEGRNFLIPVNVGIDNAGEITEKCIDTGRILSRMEIMEVETSVVMLDACRNNPFSDVSTFSGNTMNGLTGTDAPPGTIVAFATSPGKTASDGAGKNGLYTQEILNHIFKPDLKLEDLFKQVRVSVMRKSRNRQIPWETSSLVNDFYFYEQSN